jgi:hypothetical protein
MQKSVTELSKEFYVNNIVPETRPRWYKRLFVNKGNAKFLKKETWERLENESKLNVQAIGAQPWVIWADSHTVSVSDEVITITRDANGNTKHFQYGFDAFNTVCVKNLDEARKIENNNGLFVGLYAVDYTTKKVYRLTLKNDNKVRLERVVNGYVTGLPWFRGSNTAEIWGQRLDFLQNNYTGNGY